jgi:hypothetical protein
MLVLRGEERVALRTLDDGEPGLHWDRIAFCAKEVYDPARVERNYGEDVLERNELAGSRSA